VVNSLSTCPGANPAFPQGKSPTSWPASQLEKAWSLVLSFGLTLAPWQATTRTGLFTFKDASTLTSKVETRFMRKGIELWTSFVLPRRMNTEFLFLWGWCAWWRLAYIDSFQILLNTKGHWRDVDGCSLSNTIVLVLVLAFPPLLSSTSSAVLYCARACFSYVVLKSS